MSEAAEADRSITGTARHGTANTIPPPVVRHNRPLGGVEDKVDPVREDGRHGGPVHDTIAIAFVVPVEPSPPRTFGCGGSKKYSPGARVPPAVHEPVPVWDAFLLRVGLDVQERVLVGLVVLREVVLSQPRNAQDRVAGEVATALPHNPPPLARRQCTPPHPHSRPRCRWRSPGSWW